MRISNIDKQDLVVIHSAANNDEIEVTKVPVKDIEDEDLTIIVALGDKQNPVDQTHLNKATLSILYLLGANPQFTAMPQSIIVTVPDNINIYYPYAELYDTEKMTFDELANDIEINHLHDDYWFFISVGEDMPQDEVQQQFDMLQQKYNISGLIMRPKITIYSEY